MATTRADTMDAKSEHDVERLREVGQKLSKQKSSRRNRRLEMPNQRAESETLDALRRARREIDGNHAAPLRVVIPGFDHPALQLIQHAAATAIAVLDKEIDFRGSACPDAKACRHKAKNAMQEAILQSLASLNFQEAHEHQ